MATPLAIPRPEVREATKGDRLVLADVLARAFFDDPIICWLLPDERDRYARMKRFYKVELDRYRRRNLVLTTTNQAAVAMWAAPDRWRVLLADGARAAPLALAAFRGRSIAGLRLMHDVEALHPREPHWYLGILGADPARQGSGAGQAVVNAVMSRCDSEGFGAYLESSKAENVPYYERFGFTVTGEIAVPGAPVLFAMWRVPR